MLYVFCFKKIKYLSSVFNIEYIKLYVLFKERYDFTLRVLLMKNCCNIKDCLVSSSGKF